MEAGKHRGARAAEPPPVPRGKRVAMVGTALQDRRALLNGLVAAAVGAVVGSLVSLAAHDWSFAALGAALSFGGSIGYSAKEIALRERRREQAE